MVKGKKMTEEEGYQKGKTKTDLRERKMKDF